MNNIPLVSVVIPTYRREESLKIAIDSVSKQTYTNVEIIIVDDNASKANNEVVESIVKSLKSNRSIKYIKNEFNMGSSEARNIGIKNANGDFVTFLDDDDVYLPNKVGNQITHMIERGSDFSITDLMLYSEKNKLIEHRQRNYIKSDDTKDLLKYHLMYHMTGTDSIMFKKEYLIEIGCFPPIDVGDEFHLMINAIKGGGKFSYFPVCNLKAYVHSNSSSLSSGDSKVNGENKLYKYKMQYLHLFTGREKRYIKMRHFAVLSFAEVRRKRFFSFIKYSILSFFASPVDFLIEIKRIVFK